MKTALIDASSAILLYKAELFEAVASAYDLAMAPAVFQEVTVADRMGAAYPYINALLCPRILHWTGRLDRPHYLRAFDYLLKQGRYSFYVIEFAKKCNAQRLAFFMPEAV